MTKANNISEISVWVHSKPYTADPIEYDLWVHHISFRSIFASLITQYKNGAFYGIVAESWESSADLKNWRFKIRTNLTFSNGRKIANLDILESLKRIFFLQRARNSHAGIAENILGIEKFDKLDSDILGLKAIGSDTIEFRFIKPMPKFLELISFGLYSIVPFENFDRSSGKWLAQKDTVSSGAYVIEDWNEETLTLKLRNDFPTNLMASNPPPKINIDNNKSARANADIILSDSTENYFSETHEFHGAGTTDLAISYVLVSSWHANKVLAGTDVRNTLKILFYEKLKETNIQTTKSFFPLSIPGTKEFVSEKKSNKNLTLNGLNFTVMQPHRQSKLFRNVTDTLIKVLSEQGANVEEIALTTKQYWQEVHRVSKAPKADFIVMATGILVEEPKEDIKFMIASKEGIMIPDPTGNLHRLIENSHFSVQDINKALWDDSAVWPLQHYVLGIWTKKNKFDLSQINLSLPPTDFSWIGIK